jgi:hypothetical protein
MGPGGGWAAGRAAGAHAAAKSAQASAQTGTEEREGGDPMSDDAMRQRAYLSATMSAPADRDRHGRARSRIIRSEIR